MLSETGTRRISDIALEAGFSDTHFKRVFRARFGDTPRAIRARAAGRHGKGEASVNLAVA